MKNVPSIDYTVKTNKVTTIKTQKREHSQNTYS